MFLEVDEHEYRVGVEADQGTSKTKLVRVAHEALTKLIEKGAFE